MSKKSLEKISGQEQAAKELLERIEQIRNFFIKNLPILHHEAVENKSIRELLVFYQKVINSEPTRESFEKIIGELFPEQEKLSEEEKDGLFRKFLTLKLPQELVRRQLEILRLEKEEEIHEKREQSNSRMLLGFHTANLDYEGLGLIPASKILSTTQVDGKIIEVPSGFSHYSLKSLYKEVFKRGGKVFLYFIEGSLSDFSSSTQEYTEAHEEKGWIATAKQLPVIFKIEIVPEIEKELGMERG